MSRSQLLCGGEFVAFDPAAEAATRVASYLAAYAEVVPSYVLSALGDVERNPSRKTLRALDALVEDMATRTLTEADTAWAANLDTLSGLLTFHRAALGCARASAILAADALYRAGSLARSGIDRHLPEIALLMRTAQLWASDAELDAEPGHVPDAMCVRIGAFDGLASDWLSAIMVIACAEHAVGEEEALLRPGHGAGLTDPALLDQGLAALAHLGGTGRDPGTPPPTAPGIVVVPANLEHLPKPSSVSRERVDSPRALVEPVAGKAMPVTPTPDPAKFAAILRARFPWAGEAIDAFAMDLVGAPHAAFRPRLLVGLPGCGKTAFAKALIEASGLPVTVYAVAGMMDGGAFAGTSRQWGTWRPSVPLQLILQASTATVGIVVDEVEKAGNSRRWGRLDETILPYLERHTAARIHDPAIETAVDLSGVSYVLTANEIDGVGSPLRDRCQVVRWPAPRAEDLPVVAAAILAEVRAARGLDETWCPDLDGSELDALSAWRGGSLRPLRRMIEVALAARDRFTPRH
ncbi:AAA family ATPase [Methylobacterium sp. E-016]|uniref:AAA family ATPase n=1 Tax=Methylobacterium sp. E-016 TaxID=2836556 RepID=UPI001FB8E072|nr:AAA family ATPase [Methylobacterium sp. E-016]MCJ2074473.1 AAA family ATPase [Methylobacterium sp. E-016]